MKKSTMRCSPHTTYKGGTVTAKVDLKMVFINYTYLLFKCIIYYDMKVSMVGKEPLGCWVCVCTIAIALSALPDMLQLHFKSLQ